MKSIRVLSIASEIYPLIKTGELADVTGAPWIEIDFPTDVIRAAHEVLPQLQPLSGAVP